MIKLDNQFKQELIKLIKVYKLIYPSYTGKTLLELNWGQGNAVDISYTIEIKEKIDKHKT